MSRDPNTGSTIRVLNILDSPDVGGVLTYSALLEELLAGSEVRYATWAPFGLTAAARGAVEGRLTLIEEDQLEAYGADLIQVHYRHSHQAGIRVRGRKGPPILATLHGGQIRHRGAKALIGRRVDDVLKTFFAQGLISVAPTWRTGRMLRRRPLAMIPNASPLPRCCAQYSVPDRDASGRLRLGYVGRFSPEKGADRIPLLVGELLSRSSDLSSLVLWGDGPLRPSVLTELKEVLDASGKRLEIELASGRVDWSSMDVLVIPSRQEASPMVIGEALASGVKVVCSDVADHGDWAGVGDLRFVDWNADDVASAVLDAASRPHRCAGELLVRRRSSATSSFVDVVRDLVASRRQL